MEWHWHAQQEKSLKVINETLAAAAPVLAYYDAKEELTLQVDASSTCLGAALIQGGKPVAYASKALTHTQKMYAQIEKERLANGFGCAKFEEYVVGRDTIVETDHRPLGAITKSTPANVVPTPTLSWNKLGL